MEQKTITSIALFALGLVAIFFFGFLIMYSIGEAGISLLGLIKACDEESAALIEVQQDSTQKDFLILALLEKVKDKDKTVKILTKVVEEKANCEAVIDAGLIK